MSSERLHAVKRKSGRKKLIILHHTTAESADSTSYQASTRAILSGVALFVFVVGLKIGFIHALGIVFMVCASIVVLAVAFLAGRIEGWW